MVLGNLNLPGKALLAPLAGVSNRPFRILAIESGAAMVFTEMVSADGIARAQRKTLTMLYFQPDEQPLGVQLFGADPSIMNEATAVVAENYRPDLIDINFGCPVRKVVRKNGGAALLKDLDLSRHIIEAVIRAAGGIPVSIKARSGWVGAEPVFVELGRLAESAGVSLMTLHARSRAEGYSGHADWAAIRLLKESISIPVVGNGDIRTAFDAKQMLDETGCDSVMIGRAAMSNPLIFRQVNHMLETGRIPDPVTITDRIELALKHARLICREYGEERGVRMMRTHLGRYVRGFPGAARLRPLVHRVDSLEEIKQIFDTYLNTAHSASVTWSGLSESYQDAGENGCQRQ